MDMPTLCALSLHAWTYRQWEGPKRYVRFCERCNRTEWRGHDDIPKTRAMLARGATA